MCRFLLLNVVGAILHLVDGTYKVDTFEYQKPDWIDEEGGDDMDGGEDSTTTTTKHHDSVAGVCEEIRSLIAGNSIRLKDAFRAISTTAPPPSPPPTSPVRSHGLTRGPCS